MVDAVCSDSDALAKYCKARNIVLKEYPKCYQQDSNKTTSVIVNRRKKIPPKSNDNVISDHDTSTSCSEGEDNVTYVKNLKTYHKDFSFEKKSTSLTTPKVNLSTSIPTSILAATSIIINTPSVTPSSELIKSTDEALAD